MLVSGSVQRSPGPRPENTVIVHVDGQGKQSAKVIDLF